MTVAAGKRKKSMRKVAYFQFYGMEQTQRRDRGLTSAFLSQLSFCKSEEARRLILGVSEKFAAGERAA